MDYGAIVARAFAIVRRYKLLWALGFLAGLGGGGGPNLSFPGGGDFSTGNGQSATEFGEAAFEWLAANIILIVVIAIVALGVFVVFFLISSWATGALIAEVRDLESEGEEPGEHRFRKAFSKGRQPFGRIVGMRLLLFAVGLAFVVLMALLIVAIVASVMAGPAGIPIIIISGALLVALLLAAIPFFIALSVISQYASRFIVLEGEGVAAALKKGYALVRANLGPSAILWLITVGLGIAAVIVLLLAIAVVGIPTALVVGLSFAFGSLLLGVFLLVAALLVGLFLLAALGGAISAYFSTYWTLAFLELQSHEVATPYLGRWARNDPCSS